MPASSQDNAGLETDLEHVRQTWTELGEVDPLWAILSDPAKEGGRWDVTEFFRSGEREVAEALARLAELGVTVPLGTALDFGCGVGRNTQAMARRFGHAHGVDIAETMIRQADAFNRDPGRCTYHVNAHRDLRLFADGTFDFIYSRIVLQHMPPAMATAYIREFVRVLAPGGVAMFQVPAERAPRPLGPGQSHAREPLADEAFRGEIALVRRVPLPARTPARLAALWLAPGRPTTLRVAVRNLSPVNWPSVATPEGVLAVRAGNHWRDRDGELVQLDDGRADLPTDVVPGGRAVASLTVTPPETPGRYILELDLVQEGVAWFEQRGQVPTQVLANVWAPLRALRPALAERAPAAARPAFEMHAVPRNEVEAAVAETGGVMAAVLPDGSGGDPWVSWFYVVTKPARHAQE